MEQRERLPALCHTVALREGGFTLLKLRERFAFTLPKLPGRRCAFTLLELPCHAVASRPAVALREGWSAKAGRRHEQSPRKGFTLLELLVVIAIIAIVFTFLLPSLGPGTGRSAEAAARQLTADLDGARLTALAERTRTRILFPTSSANFTAGTSSTAWPTDIAYRGYLIVSEKRTDPVWKQRGKWNRFSQGTALASVSPTPAPTAMPIDVSGNGSTSYKFNGPYIEFLANGSSNLNPSATPTAAVVADGFVDATGKFVRKNTKLQYTITVDPLTGAVSLQ